MWGKPKPPWPWRQLAQQFKEAAHGSAARAWSRASPCKLQNAAVAVDTVVMGMDWLPGARKGKLRAFTAEAPALGILVSSALPPPQHSGPPQPASQPWWSCQLGQRQSGRTPAHTALPCFGLQQGIGQGRGRSPLPQLGSGPPTAPWRASSKWTSHLWIEEALVKGRLEWYGFGLRRSKRVHPPLCCC